MVFLSCSWWGHNIHAPFPLVYVVLPLALTSPSLSASIHINDLHWCHLSFLC
jgi:hypothetical protein